MLQKQKKAIRRHFYDCRFIYLAFWITAAIFLTVSASRGLWPFGQKAILKVDLFHQYAPFLAELRSRILSRKSLIYSWETGLGKNFLAQTAYYASSPLNILLFLFPEKRLPEAVFVLIMLKMCLCSSSFTWYLREHFRRNDLSILFFGLLYGFCAFLTCYYWDVMWLDTVALFPLTALGCERLIREKKVGLYYFSLTLTMIANFYLAVLVCILITLYAIVIVLESLPERSLSMTANDCTCLSDIDPARAAARFIVISLLCAMTAMFILAPVAFTLGETQASSRVFPALDFYYNIWQLLPAHFLGARGAILAKNSNHPNIYSGLLTIVLLPLYYSCRKIRLREKLLHTALLLFMLLCSCFAPLDYLIHGLHFPASLPHRYTFVYSFFLLCMSYRGGAEYLFPDAADEPMENVGCQKHTVLPALYRTAAFYVTSILVYELFIANAMKEIDHILSITDILLNICLIAAYLFLIHSVIVKGRLRRLILPVLLILVTGECIFSFHENLIGTTYKDDYVSWIDDTRSATDYMEKRENNSFFRAEYRRFLTINEGSMYHYKGFSQFSSLAPGNICALMQDLGLAATGNSFRYYDTSPLIDSIFGIRYILSREDLPSQDLAYKYTFREQIGKVRVCENNRVLPLGFMTDPEILNWKTADSQPFDVQNDFLHTAAGTKDDLYTLIEPELISCKNMETIPDSTNKNEFSYSLADPYDLLAIPSVHARFVSDKNQYVTLYVDATNARRFIYRTSKTRENRELSAGRCMINIGLMAKGEPLEIDFELTSRSEYDLCYPSSGQVRIFAAGWNDGVFQDAYEHLSRETFQITSFTDTEIHGSIHASKDGVFLTSIPCTKGWEAYVDGLPAQKLGIGGGALLGIPLSAGSHDIILKYRFPYLGLSAACSLTGLILFLIIWSRERLR